MSVQRIAMVHYHMRPGGVARVIGNAVAALRGTDCRTLVLAGAPLRPAGLRANEYRCVPSLDYAEGGRPPPSAERLVDTLETAARRALGGPADLWHFHNHSLGRNAAVCHAVYQLARQGRRLLLQIHDFPEDSRPANYRGLMRAAAADDPDALAALLYPQGANVHYAVLNRRDRTFLCRAGLAPERAHVLPNAVALDSGKSGSSAVCRGNGRFFLYPTRAIRRKNLGEMLLWSAAAEPEDRFAATLAPASPADVQPYRRWVGLARQLKLPVEFEIGRDARCSFPELLCSATAVMTTSVAEGFGLVFLEPWLAGRPLAGRDLPEITRDFSEEGVRLKDLYTRLSIPLDWMNAAAVRSKITSGLRRLLSAYGRKLRSGDAERAYRAAVRGGRADFGRLDEDLQMRVVRLLRSSRARKSELSPRQLFIKNPPAGIMRRNGEIIRREYGVAQYRRELERIYSLVGGCARKPLGAISGGALLDQFLAPERFFLLRT